MVKTRVVFLGTPEFAVPTLLGLLAAPDLEVVGVITQPDRPSGRGMKLTPPPVKTVSLERRIPILQPARLKGNEDALAFLEDCRPDLGVVAAFGQLLPGSVFDGPPFGMLNVHASLLPRYRGAAPVAYAIWNGERLTGVTIMKIDEGLDSGELLASRPCDIGPNQTTGELTLQLAQLGSDLLLETIPGYLTGRIVPEPQDHLAATYAPRIRKEQAQIDWTEPAKRLHNQIRALNPAPGAYCSFRDSRLKIWVSRPGESESQPGQPGEILESGSQGLSVCCGSGTVLLIQEVQAAGRNRIPAVDFVRGAGVYRGELLT